MIWSPTLWGGLASLTFFALVRLGRLHNPLVLRYCAHNAVEMVSTTMFFVALAALAIKALRAAVQFAALNQEVLDPIPPGGDSVEVVPRLLTRLAALSAFSRGSCLVERLRDALEFVQRKGHARSLDDQMRYLADVDAARVHGDYALVRVVTWSLPILGLLGTVIGMTQAVPNLTLDNLEDSLPGITAGLGVAFDTTTVSLAMAMVLMFAQFLAERYENSLLAVVDARMNVELTGRFTQADEARGGDPSAVRGIAETVVQATEKLVQRQTELWRASIEDVQKQWSGRTGRGAAAEPALAAAAANGGAAAAVLSQPGLSPAEATLWQSHDPVSHGEVMRELIEIIHKPSRNWPTRRTVRSW